MSPVINQELFQNILICIEESAGHDFGPWDMLRLQTNDLCRC